MVLHLALLAGLTGVKNNIDPGAGVSPQRLAVTLVHAARPDPSAAGQARMPEPDAGADVAPAPDPAALATAVSPPHDDDSPAAGEAARAEERLTDVPQAAPRRREPLRIESVPQDDMIAAGPQALGPAPETVSMAAVEVEQLTAHITEWAESFAASAEPKAVRTWDDGDGALRAEVLRLPGDESGYDGAIVTISKVSGGRTYSTRVRMQRLGFSHYAQFVDRWDPEVQIHDDKIAGRFHSNSEISIQRSKDAQPIFLGKVTTARSINTSRSDRRIRRDQVFLGGLETRVRRVALPDIQSLFDAESAPDYVFEVSNETRVRFTADGTLRWEEIETRRAARARTRAEARARRVPANSAADVPSAPPAGIVRYDPDKPFYVVAAQGTKLHLAGVVNGQILVYSPDTIVIEGNLVYARHPVKDPDGDDYLGLVARNIRVASRRITGDGDLAIHGALFAHDRFAIDGYAGRRSGELSVIGSVTAGSMTATEPRYATRVTFDERLGSRRPPGFPLTERYEIAQFDGLWEISPGSVRE